MVSVITEIRLALRRASRLLFAARVRRAVSGPRPITLGLLFLLILVVTAGLDASLSANNLAFNEWGVVSALASAAVFSAVIVALSGGTRRPPLRRALGDVFGLNLIYLAFTGLASAAYFLLAGHLVASGDTLDTAWSVIGYAALGWLFFACWRAGRHLWTEPLRLPGARFVAALLLALAIVPTQPIIYGDDTSWDALNVWSLGREAVASLAQPAVSEAYTPPQTAIEDTLYRQPSLLSGTLGGILPSKNGSPQYFFLAAAPSAAQDVFRNEVRGAQQLFDERFGTRGHSAVLVNSFDTLDTVPLASLKNIEVALQEIGAVMDRERDVLVLFVTSHGTRGQISVDLAGYPLNQITPDNLAAALDNAHIKNRVLIISACHSGSFIPRLANPDTLVMTAASTDRTSFGCANGRDWTYFGDALINHALRQETSFIKAFETADSLIKSWEFWRFFMKASQPQMSIGAAIADTLAAVDAERHRLQASSILTR